MKVLVTAGPTREYIDDVRYISNASSGKVGYSIASACAARGHKVTLISGPVSLVPPANVKFISVTSAAEMERAVVRYFRSMDALIMTAAVSDYRPVKRIEGKMKRGAGKILLPLIPNPDILQRVCRNKGGKIVVGFALEVNNTYDGALKKLREKNLDYIVVNSPPTIGSDKITCKILRHDGDVIKTLINKPKKQLADEIIKLLEETVP